MSLIITLIILKRLKASQFSVTLNPKSLELVGTSLVVLSYYQFQYLLCVYPVYLLVHVLHHYSFVIVMFHSASSCLYMSCHRDILFSTLNCTL